MLSDFNSPVKIPFFESAQLVIKDVAAGGKHSLYLTESGAVYASGMNDFGQIGVKGSQK